MEKVKAGPFWYTPEQLKMVDRLGGTHWVKDGLLVVVMSPKYLLAVEADGSMTLENPQWAT